MHSSFSIKCFLTSEVHFINNEYENCQLQLNADKIILKFTALYVSVLCGNYHIYHILIKIMIYHSTLWGFDDGVGLSDTISFFLGFVI